MNKYNHSQIEKKWQEYWGKKKTFVTKNFSKKPKKYILVEFPYPSGAGLHMGHLRPYVAADVYSRFLRAKGHEVLFPIGWDAFGLPAENYAIKMGVHPSITTAQNVKNAKKQLESWGMSFDWSREINTTDPDYYKWTQWLFLQFYKKGLAYEATGLINWCPKDKTGLANEEVIDGKCERCGTEVEKKELRQWYLKITEYAEKLLEGLKTLPEWPEAVKLQQENWIGKSTGAEITFPIKFQQTEKNNFVLLHGFNGNSEGIFFPWLKKELAKSGLVYQAPNLPHPENPTEEEQVNFVLQNCKFDENTIIFGHSLGAVVALKVLEKLNIKIAGLVLAGGFVTPDFKDRPRPFHKFFNWKFDFAKIRSNTATTLILSDPRDYAVYFEQGKILQKELNGILIEKTGNLPHYTSLEEPLILESLAPFVKVFTTRPDTIFGATYVVLAPEHPLLQNFRLKISNWKEVEKYISKASQKSDLDRTAEGKEKTGVEIKGLKAVNPATKEEIPVWVADYVLGHYGTGAIMAVPGHDERDNEFATKFNLPINYVVSPQIKFEEKNIETLKTYEEHADRYAERTVRVVEGVYQKWIESFLDQIDKQSKILELGSGRGLDSNYIEEKGFVVDRTDGAQSFIDHQKNLGKNVSKLNLLTDSIENNKYDLIFANKVLLHFNKEQFKQIVIKINHGLKNYGIFALCVMDFVKAKEQYSKDPKMESLRYFYYWNKKDLEAELKTLGFELVDSFENERNETGYQDLLLIVKKVSSPVFTNYGVVVNSQKFNGLKTEEAILKMAEEYGKVKTQYKLRDWVFSRQRYWGEPIPIIHCEDCGIVPVPEKDLPVKLPNVKKYEPTGTGESPLADILKWVKTKCPNCKKLAWRETNTMPQWAGSSWYWLRYTDPKNKKQFASIKNQKYWTPVDVYFGGMEHTTLHLLYSRFWNLFFADQQLVSEKEPYKKRLPHGIILGPDGEKMSKSRGNVVNPDSIVFSHGADTLRMYELFLGPHEATVSWNEQGHVGVKRFLDRIWIWVNEIVEAPHSKSQNPKSKIQNDTPKVEKALHKLIKKITEDIEAYRFNTCISAFMEFHNTVKDDFITLQSLKTFLILLYPFAPHIAEELNLLVSESLGKQLRKKVKSQSLQLEHWPEFDPGLVIDKTVEIIVQVNGKVKGKLTVNFASTEDTVKEEALKLEVVKQAMISETIKRVVFVPNRLINLVI